MKSMHSTADVLPPYINLDRNHLGHLPGEGRELVEWPKVGAEALI